MKKLLLPGVVVSLVVCCMLGCDESSPESETPPTYAIYNGDPRPACTSTARNGRTDLVAPATVDTLHWSAPQKVSAPISNDCPTDDAEISADGQTLYFYWSPDLDLTPLQLLQGTTGVYVAHRTGGPGEFSYPTFLDLRRGAEAGASDGHPRLTAAGDTVYFHSARAENVGNQQQPPVNDILDVYVAAITAGLPGPAKNLGNAINSIYMDGEPGISPDGRTLYFTSDRPGGLGKGDIYYSTLSGATWSAPVNLGAPINSADADVQAEFASNDPSTMYFVSDRNSMGMAIYRSHHDGASWEAPVLVVQGQVGSPSLTADGGIMYFVHILTDNTPGDPVFGADIYYVTRK